MTRHQVERGNEPPAASSVRTAATCANTAFAAVRAGAPVPAACHSPLRGIRRTEQAPFTVIGQSRTPRPLQVPAQFPGQGVRERFGQRLLGQRLSVNQGGPTI